MEEEYKTYKFEELSERAQEKVIEQIINEYHEYDDGLAYQDIIEEICEEIKKDIGLSFICEDFEWNVGYPNTYLNLNISDIARELGKKYSEVWDLEVDDDLSLYSIDFDEDEEGKCDISDIGKIEIQRKIANDLNNLKKLLEKGKKLLWREYDYTTSDEFVKEEIESRELEFSEEGEIV